MISKPPKLYRSSKETPDDISAWLCQNKADPLAAACEEIHMLRGALHNSNRELSEKIGPALAVMDLGRDYVKTVDKPMEAFNKGEKE